MASNIIKLSLSSLLVLLFFNCKNAEKSDQNVIKISTDTCRYYRYDAGQIISNLGCKNCHLSLSIEKTDGKGSTTFRGLAVMDSLKLIDYAFTKNHKGWYSKNGPLRAARMDTLSKCQIKNVIRYIKDFGRDIPVAAK